MIIFKKASDLSAFLGLQREKGKKTGFVPTMGALHRGHISLIGLARQANDISICSIFVNPTQFNDPGDFEKYPVTIEADIALLEAAGCSVLFLPTTLEMYPRGPENGMTYDLGYLEDILEGQYRPGHFQGVCRVVHRLLEIVGPANLYLGQKDYQQCMVIARLLRLVGLANTVTLNISPTLRENDGLAMSSRNIRLGEQEREMAPAIAQSLGLIREGLGQGDLNRLKEDAWKFLVEKGFRPDYVEIADAADLHTVHEWNGTQKLVALVAAHLNEVRLIDNILLN